MTEEFWITTDGSLLDADNDNSPGHEAHVICHARSLILGHLGINLGHFGEDDLGDDSIWGGILKLAGYRLDVDALAWLSDLIGATEDERLARKLAAMANDNCDLRLAAITEWGWIWVRGDTVGIRDLTPEMRRRFMAGLENIFDTLGIEPGTEPDLSVNVHKSGGVRVMSYEEIREGHSPSAAPVGVLAGNGYASHLDRSATPACYRGGLGD